MCIRDSIKKAQADATNLLGDVAKSKTSVVAPPVMPPLDGTKPVEPVTEPTTKVISNDSRQDVAAGEAIEILESLKSQLAENEKRKLNVSWSIIEEAGE